MKTIQLLCIILFVLSVHSIAQSKLIKGEDGVWREETSISKPAKTDNKTSSALKEDESKIPEEIEQEIRRIFTAKYPNNQSLQKVMIEDQFASYQYLLGYTSVTGMPQKTFEQLKQQYAALYPYDYSIQKSKLQEQVAAYEFMKSYLRAPGFPQKTFIKLKKQYQSDYPYDFLKQKISLQAQVQAHLDNKKKK